MCQIQEFQSNSGQPDKGKHHHVMLQIYILKTNLKKCFLCLSGADLEEQLAIKF